MSAPPRRLVFFFFSPKREQQIRHCVRHAEPTPDSVGHPARGFLPRPKTSPPQPLHTTSSAVRAAAKTHYFPDTSVRAQVSSPGTPPLLPLSSFSLQAVSLLSGLFFFFLFFRLSTSGLKVANSQRSPTTFELDKTNRPITPCRAACSLPISAADVKNCHCAAT